MTGDHAGQAPDLAELGHELRAPLAAIAAAAELMRREALGPLAPEYRRYAERIEAASAHALHLAETLLAIGGRREDFRVLSLANLVRDTAAWFEPRCAAANLSLNLAPNQDALPVRGDALALRQILINLLDNAVQRTAVGGEIRVGATAHDGFAQLSVDNRGEVQPSGGCGISAGMGLRLVRAYCGRHGGDLALTPGSSGLLAVVRLPLAMSES